jgi:hypothetical protein
MPGPQLTLTDVAQRLKTFEDEHYYDYPNEDLQVGCLAVYEKEKRARNYPPSSDFCATMWNGRRNASA